MPLLLYFLFLLFSSFFFIRYFVYRPRMEMPAYAVIYIALPLMPFVFIFLFRDEILSRSSMLREDASAFLPSSFPSLPIIRCQGNRQMPTTREEPPYARHAFTPSPSSLVSIFRRCFHLPHLSFCLFHFCCRHYHYYCWMI